MIPRASICAALLAGLASAASAGPPAAPDPDGLTAYLTGGVSLPSDPPELVDFWKPGPAVEAGLGIRVSPIWEVVASIAWQRFPADEAAQSEDLLLSGPGGVLEVASIDGRDATALTVTAELRFHVPTESRRVLPFLSFGWGYFDISTSDATVSATDPGFEPVVVLGDTDSAFGVTIGGGVQVPVSAGARILLDSAYTVGFTERISTQYLPLRLGIGVAL